MLMLRRASRLRPLASAPRLLASSSPRLQSSSPSASSSSSSSSPSSSYHTSSSPNHAPAPSSASRSLSTSSTSQAQAQAQGARKSTALPDLALDPSFDALLGDMQMRAPSERDSVKLREVDGQDVSRVSGSGGFGIRRDDAEEEEHYADRREERRSPATLLGTKKIGMVVLPDKLVEGVQDTIEALEDKKDVRYAYLELLKPVMEKSPGGSRNMPQHAVARASAFLPAQYGATFNVLQEFKDRIGDVTGPILEVSGGLGPGLWASSEVFGTEALKDYTLVHRTRFGLDLAKDLAKGIDAEVSFKRDVSAVSMPPPQVTLATYALSVLPTARGRIDLMQHLLDTGAEHIVLVDLAGEAGWTAMKQARKWFLSKSTEAEPLHIAAPCPHDGVCPRFDMLESCAFSQRVQRPAFTRKTKHAKRGEEDVTYSYLIISKGPRPFAQNGIEEGVGRWGAVGREAVARAIAKMEGKTEIREVEGGEGEMEVVELAHGVELPVMDEDPEATNAHLKAESYSWPRLVAPPLKRSGFVIMDTCTADEKLVRFTVAKSLGKQSYYDARKSGWGDLWPHAFKGAVERPRGIRRLTEPTIEDLGLPMDEEFQFMDLQDMDSEVKLRPDLDAMIAEMAKGALVPEGNADAPASGSASGDQSQSQEYEYERETELSLPPKREDKVPRKRGELKANPTEAAKKRAAEREKREMAKERKVKLRDARLDKQEKRERAMIRDADTATVRAFEADDAAAEEFELRDLPAGMRDMGSALGRRKRRGPSFPFNFGGSAREMHTSARVNSVAPGATSPGMTSRRLKVNVGSLQAQHEARDPITMLTAYDYPTSLLCSKAGIDIVLVGDSMAQVCLGHDTTLPLTLDEVVHHTRAVSRGVGSSFLLVDMPFGYVAASVEDGVKAAVRLVKEGGADGIKIEGGREILPLVRRLADFGIPVMPHIGLQPQRIGVTGYKAQGRNAAAAADMVALALEMQSAGAFSLLVEAVPHHVGTAIAETVGIPTIGIGAGPNTSGQVLVVTDVIGTLDVGPEEGGEDVAPKLPKFVRQFGNVGRESRKAVDEYVAQVKTRGYPAVPKETYGMPKEELEEFKRLLATKKEGETLA